MELHPLPKAKPELVLPRALSEGIDMNPPKPSQMIVDCPFLFLIEDRQTKTVLFMGVVYDPGASS